MSSTNPASIPPDEIRRSYAVMMHPEERLRLIEENVRDYAMVVLTADGIIANWNAGAENIMGWTESEVASRHCSLFFSPEDRIQGIPWDEMAEAAAAGKALDERWHMRKDGSRFWGSGIMTSLRDHDGSLRGFIKIFRDGTAQKQAEIDLAASYRRERRTAEVLQRSLLLGTLVDHFAGLEVAAEYESASDDLLVGGDFYDVFPLADHQVAFVVGDVVGKGLGAAAQTAQIKFALRVLVREYPQPAIALERLNAFLCEGDQLDGRSEEMETQFVMLCLGIFDTVSGDLFFAGAGIEPPLILRTTGESEQVELHGMPVGMMNKAEFTRTTAHLDFGDIVLLATDGITEARQDGDFLGADGLSRLALQSVSRSPLAEMAQTIIQGARDFGGGTFRDDACLLLIRRR